MPLPALIPAVTTAGSWIARSAATSFVMDKAMDLISPDDDDKHDEKQNVNDGQSVHDGHDAVDSNRGMSQASSQFVPSQVMYSGPDYGPDSIDTVQFNPNEVRAAQREQYAQQQPMQQQQAVATPASAASGFGVSAPSTATAAITASQQEHQRDEMSRQRLSDGILSAGAAASSLVLGDLAQQKMEGKDVSGMMNGRTALLAGINAFSGGMAAKVRGEDFVSSSAKAIAGAGSGAVTKLTFDGIQDADGGHVQSGVMGALGGVLNNFVGGNESSMLSSGMTGALGALGTDIAHDTAANSGHQTIADTLGVAGLTGLNTYTSTDSGVSAGITAALGAGSAAVQSPSTDEPLVDEGMEME